MNYVTFTNMTPDEFIRMNSNSIPEFLLVHMEAMSKRISELESDVKILERNCELSDEQSSFARDLVEQIDQWVKDSTMTKKKKIEYSMIRENSYFEV